MGGLKRWLRDLACDVATAVLAFRDPSVPLAAKAVSLLSVLYIVMPLDLIPDVIPVLGWIDDLASIPIAAYLAGRLIPAGVLAGLRERAEIKVMRWGPRAFWIAAAAFVVWLVLAGIGGWLFFFRDPPAPPRPPMVFVPPGGDASPTPAAP